jgi:hypothetical protein
MYMMKNKNIENLVYLSQIDAHDIFVYADDALELLEWLNCNGNEVQSWEAFIETKKEIIRTLNFANKVDSPYRSKGQPILKIKNDIEVAIDDWSKNSQDSRLIICLNLQNELKPKVKLISITSRIFAGILGLFCLGILGMVIVGIINDKSFKNVEWVPFFSTLICAPAFLYASFTGKGDLDFIAPENIFKKLRKKRILTESGQLRWPTNA